MTTLAQLFIEGGFVPVEADPRRQQIADWAHGYVHSRLMRPDTQGCVLSVDNIAEVAERFVFEA